MRPSRKVAAIAAGTSVSIPLPLPVKWKVPSANTRSPRSRTSAKLKMAGPIVRSSVGNPLPYAVMAHVASLQRGLLGLEHDIGVVEPEPAVEDARSCVSVDRLGSFSKAVEHLGALDEPLQVLLRHRPRSISLLP